MALSLYCMECGARHEYSARKPKFCGACGSPFDLTAKASTETIRVQEPVRPQRQRLIAKTRNEEEEEELGEIDGGSPDGDVDVVPEIKKIDYEIEGAPIKKQTIGDVVSIGGTPKKERRDGIIVKTKKQRAEFLEQFRREAGTLRKNV